jgi:RNA polymerase sigma-70 factor (ECF subfamily)
MPRKTTTSVEAMLTVARNSASSTPLHGAPDAALVALAATGDHRAFEVIMRRNNRALYRTARSVLKDDADAEEALQDAYIRAYQALPQFRSESSLSTWLTRIVLNKSLERLRKRKRQPVSASTDNIVDFEKHLQMASLDNSSTQSPERAAMRAQMRTLLERRIDELPAPFRTVFVLRALEDLSVEECAECLGLPAATVRTRFFRARRLLRRSLAADLHVAVDEAFAFDGARCDRIVETVLARIASPPGS